MNATPPPSSNTGVSSEQRWNIAPLDVEIEGRFDWYQATVPASPEALISDLLAAMPEGVERQNGKGMNSFAARADLCDRDGEVYATVMHGGINPLPNVKATGDHAPALAHLLRFAWPEHRVSRLDVAIDYRGEDAFEDTVRLMGNVGREYRLKGEKIIPDDLDDGSTYYLGARAAALRVRCYEKGKQLFKLTGDPLWRSLFDWTRIELQVRPQRDFKSRSAFMEPIDFWGCSDWTRQIAEGALNMTVEPIQMRPTRIADHERAMRFLTSQYGKTILRQVEKLGSWERFTDDLRCRLGDDFELPMQHDAA